MKRLKILGIEFVNEPLQSCFSEMITSGGLMTVPSGPGLATIPDAPVYYRSLLLSDYVLADSGYMALIWNIFHGNKIRRISGLEFIEYFLLEANKSEKILIINPNEEEGNANRELLVESGFLRDNVYTYTAPFYGKNREIFDEALIKLALQFDPKYILVNLGGNTQEILGLYLKHQLKTSPFIICTGAAIAFKTGFQADIPVWADRMFMGWLFRCISNPKLYIPRYLASFKLLFLLLKHGAHKIT